MLIEFMCTNSKLLEGVLTYKRREREASLLGNDWQEQRKHYNSTQILWDPIVITEKVYLKPGLLSPRYRPGASKIYSVEKMQKVC